jgi:predicted nucleic acid-binding Zn ribbon protein
VGDGGGRHVIVCGLWVGCEEQVCGDG